MSLCCGVMVISILPRSAQNGASISLVRETGSTRSGTFSCSRHGSARIAARRNFRHQRPWLSPRCRDRFCAPIRADCLSDKPTLRFPTVTRMRLQTSEPLVDRLRTESDAAAKRDVLGRHFDDLAEERDRWKARNRYYHAEIEKLCRSFIPPGSAVLELGSSTGDL